MLVWPVFKLAHEPNQLIIGIVIQTLMLVPVAQQPVIEFAPVYGAVLLFPANLMRHVQDFFAHDVFLHLLSILVWLVGEVIDKALALIAAHLAAVLCTRMREAANQLVLVLHQARVIKEIVQLFVLSFGASHDCGVSLVRFSTHFLRFFTSIYSMPKRWK